MRYFSSYTTLDRDSANALIEILNIHFNCSLVYYLDFHLGYICLSLQLSTNSAVVTYIYALSNHVRLSLFPKALQVYSPLVRYLYKQRFKVLLSQTILNSNQHVSTNH